MKLTLIIINFLSVHVNKNYFITIIKKPEEILYILPTRFVHPLPLYLASRTMDKWTVNIS